jgi:hypothetical protein
LQHLLLIKIFRKTNFCHICGVLTLSKVNAFKYQKVRIRGPVGYFLRNQFGQKNSHATVPIIFVYVTRRPFFGRLFLTKKPFLQSDSVFLSKMFKYNLSPNIIFLYLFFPCLDHRLLRGYKIYGGIFSQNG